MNSDNAPDSGSHLTRLELLRNADSLHNRPINTLPEGERLLVVQAAQGKEKLDLIIEAVDGAHLLRRLPLQEVYLLVRQLGQEDTVELLGLCQTEQLVGLLDLDGWEDDRLDPARSQEWMFQLLECGEEKVLETAREMELELLALLVQQRVRIVSGPEDIDDDDARTEAMHRSGGYVLDFDDEESAKIVGAWLDILFRRDQELYLRVLETVRWELPAMLEEEVAGWRNGRLLDHGFPEPADARAVYGWLDPVQFDPAQHHKVQPVDFLAGVEAPSYMLARVDHVHLLADVLARGITSEAAWELVYLLNKVMRADRIDVGEMDEVAACVERVYGTLDIALEHLCGHDSGRAAELFDTVWLESLFRLGHSLALGLQHRARAIQHSRIEPFIDAPYRAMLEALLQRPPFFYQGLVEIDRSDTHPFMTLEQIGLCSAWLDRLERQLRLFTGMFEFTLQHPEAYDLDGCQPAQGEDLTLSQLFLTAFANRLLGLRPAPEPLPAALLGRLQLLVTDGSGLKPQVRQECLDWLESLEEGAGEFGAWCLDQWEDELCRHPVDQLDPRYVTSLILRLTPA